MFRTYDLGDYSHRVFIVPVELRSSCLFDDLDHKVLSLVGFEPVQCQV